MKIQKTEQLHTAFLPSGRPILTLYKAMVEKEDGHQFPYFFFGRGGGLAPPPMGQKLPDAVVIVAIVPRYKAADGAYVVDRVVLVDEFRPPVGGREVSFPAGLIDPTDYEGNTTLGAVRKAAVREFKEETGMELTRITEVGPQVYSTGGMTNESCVYVFGYAEGEPSSQFLEQGEDIRVILADHRTIVEVMESRVCAKTVWPFLWAFRRHGITFA